MENKGLLNKASELREEDSLEEKPKSFFLIFSYGENLFAIQSKKVKEILRECKIFHLPFVPNFIMGLTLWRGNLVSVLDLQKIPNILKNDMPEENLQEPLFLIFENQDSTYCVKIHKIVEYFGLIIEDGVDEDLIKEIKFNDNLVPVLDDQYITEFLKRNLKYE